MALAAIADDKDFLALDQVQIGVAIVINTHGDFLFERAATGRWIRLSDWIGPAGRPQISGVV
jgi:hypothetical protein